MRPATIVIMLLLAACDRSSSAAGDNAAPAASSPSRPQRAFGWLELDPSRPLAPMLADEAAAAIAAGKKPTAYLHADWCGPCQAIARTRSDPDMQRAFAGTHIVAIDIDRADSTELTALGLSTSSIPVFYRLGRDGRPTGASITGGAWGEDIPANMAPPLAAFFAQ